MNFRTGHFDIISTNNEPEHGNVGSGVLWVPNLDTWRISTASGVREVRTGHGIVQVHRSSSATAQTFTTTVTAVNWDVTDIIDDQYYTHSGNTITIKEVGIYKIAFNQQIGISSGTSRSIAVTLAGINGMGDESVSSFSYHRTVGQGRDSASSSYFIEITQANTTISIFSKRDSGGSTLNYRAGCNCSIERVSSLRQSV